MKLKAVLLSLILALGGGDAAESALVYLRDQDDPVPGYVDQGDAQVVVVRQLLPGGQSREIRIPREQVDEIVPTVDIQRLEKLTPDNPRAYRDYAEDLAYVWQQQSDSEARDTSLRLFLIAAELDREGLGRSCLLGMADIAATPAEARRYRSMAYLLDPKHSRAPLERDRQPATGPAAAIDEDDKTVLRAVQALRRDDARRARLLAEQPGFEKALGKWSRFVAYTEFLNATRGGLDDSLLRKLLQLELAIQATGAAAASTEAGEPAEWSETVSRDGIAPAFPLELATITRWDPAECIHRNGRWKRPDKPEAN